MSFNGFAAYNEKVKKAMHASVRSDEHVIEILKNKVDKVNAPTNLFRDADEILAPFDEQLLILKELIKQI